MGGSEAVRIDTVSRVTPGQVTWLFLNRIIDDDERERRVHLKCKAKWNETRCEVCGEPIDLLSDYQDELSKRAYSPREYVEHQLTMSEEEKEQRRIFFTELFEKTERERDGNHTQTARS